MPYNPILMEVSRHKMILRAEKVKTEEFRIDARELREDWKDALNMWEKKIEECFQLKEKLYECEQNLKKSLEGGRRIAIRHVKTMINMKNAEEELSSTRKELLKNKETHSASEITIEQQWAEINKLKAELAYLTNKAGKRSLKVPSLECKMEDLNLG
jgi:chromosome segregation ATPase